MHSMQYGHIARFRPRIVGTPDPETGVMHKNTDTWGSVSRSFHWLIVALLIVQGALGLLLDDLPRGSIRLHVSIGITILALAIARLAWRLYAGRPAPMPGVLPWQRRTAAVGHFLLYVLLFATPITGWLMSNYGDHPVRWFGLFELPHLVAPNDDAHEIMESRHQLMFWLLAIVATLHALAATYHHFILRNATLTRMWRGS
ncbi:cytochrome b [Solilutibacter silvestris]|uniref:Cytochrome B561 n=1 Tax=Solilutibacter silvestris TaxID=1645665 RepID=A0A2K1PXB3_9GAMM|nr:cytochrome b [Lysobacter silvestris]PNS07435.1 Cytochrome B561 [Lysobacter silvestris]